MSDCWDVELLRCQVAEMSNSLLDYQTFTGLSSSFPVRIMARDFFYKTNGSKMYMIFIKCVSYSFPSHSRLIPISFPSHSHLSFSSPIPTSRFHLSHSHLIFMTAWWKLHGHPRPLQLQEVAMPKLVLLKLAS